MRGHGERVPDVAMVDEVTVALGGDDNKVRLWDTRLAVAVATLDAGEGVSSVASLGAHLGAAGMRNSGVIEAWDVRRVGLRRRRRWFPSHLVALAVTLQPRDDAVGTPIGCATSSHCPTAASPAPATTARCASGT